MNENYVQPAMPKGVEQGILKGMYLLQTGGARQGARHAAGLAARSCAKCIAAAEILEKRLRHSRRISTRRPASPSCVARRSRSSAGIACIRARRARTPYVTQALSKATGPFIAATDYMRAVAGP